MSPASACAVYTAENKLKKERGKLILHLFAQDDLLQETALVRDPETVKERNQRWAKIAHQVNDTFGQRLDYLSVPRIKKLHMYYRKRDEIEVATGQEDSEAAHSDPPAPRVEAPPPVANEVVEEAVVMEEGEIQATTSTETPVVNPLDALAFNGLFNNTLLHVLQGVVKNEMDEQNLLGVPRWQPGERREAQEGDCHQDDIHTDILNDLAVGLASGDYSPQSTTPKITEARSTRADYVFDLATFYQERLCFKDKTFGDRSIRFGRSSSVNAERTMMWKKITEMTNEKFGVVLGYVDNEQVKKIYTNRLSRPKKGSPQVDVSGEAESATGAVHCAISISPSGTLDAAGQLPPTMLQMTPPSSFTLPSAVTPPIHRKTHPATKKARLSGSEQSPPPPSMVLPASIPSPLPADPSSLLLVHAKELTNEERMQCLLRSFDRSDEVTRLKDDLVNKDREIERLKRTVVEMADDYRRRTVAMLDAIKVGVNNQLAEDIARALQVHPRS